MERQKRTRKGFIVRKRCDECGRRVDITADTGDSCTLKCSLCGKVYKFRIRSDS